LPKERAGSDYLFIKSGSDIQKTEHQVRKVITNDNFCFSPLL